MCIVWSLTIFTVILLFILITKHFQYDSTTLFDCCPYSLWYYYAVWLLNIFSVILQCCFILRIIFSVILLCCFILRTRFNVILLCCLRTFFSVILLFCLTAKHFQCEIITMLFGRSPYSLWYYCTLWLLTTFTFSVLLEYCLIYIHIIVILLCCLIANHVRFDVASHIECDIAMLFANHFSVILLCRLIANHIQWDITVLVDC